MADPEAAAAPVPPQDALGSPGAFDLAKCTRLFAECERVCAEAAAAKAAKAVQAAAKAEFEAMD